MHFIKQANFPLTLAIALLLYAASVASLSAATPAVASVALAVNKSGNDLVLSFPTSSPDFYTVQTCPDLLQPWTNLQPGIPGDGTVNTFTIANALSVDKGFYRLQIQSPIRLLLPQAMAFSVLGHSCGGIREQAYVTAFDPAGVYLAGEVYLSTTCSTGGRGSRPATFTAWAAVTWDFAGNVISFGHLSNAPPVNPTFNAVDPFGDAIFNAGGAAYLVVPVPGVAVGVTAVQSGDQFEISWTPTAVNPAAITSSMLTATPINSSAAILTSTVAGSATTGVIPSLQPQTTYQITIVNTTIAGSSPASAPLTVTTFTASIPPSVPDGVSAHWTNLDPTGTTDTLVATWQAAVPGDSPIDEYLVSIVGSDGAGTFTQTVSGTTLTASFSVDYIPNWSVTVQAHNAVGWGPSSPAVTLGGL